MSQRYPIPDGTIRTELIVKRSKFITTVGYADTVDAAREFIHQIRDEMPDAAHHVYAFRVGYGSSVNEGLSDDGEPAGTSGKPTMTVLRGVDLGDVVLVTTRYFGGTKLGTGGLVRAYSHAAQEALRQLRVTEKISLVSLCANVPYHCYDAFTRALAEYDAQIQEAHFARNVRVFFMIPEDLMDAAMPRLREYTEQNVSPTMITGRQKNCR